MPQFTALCITCVWWELVNNAAYSVITASNAGVPTQQCGCGNIVPISSLPLGHPDKTTLKLLTKSMLSPLALLASLAMSARLVVLTIIG